MPATLYSVDFFAPLEFLLESKKLYTNSLKNPILVISENTKKEYHRSTISEPFLFVFMLFYITGRLSIFETGILPSGNSLINSVAKDSIVSYSKLSI